MALTEQRLLAEMVDRGVDDAVALPRSPEELLARVLVITRRSLRETEKWLAEAPVH